MTAHILSLIATIRRAYEPRVTAWTNKSVDEQKQVTREWVDMLSRYHDTVPSRAVIRWMASDNAQWAPSLIDIVRLCQQIAREDLEERSRQLPPGTACDGTRWIHHNNTTVPCPRCNPILANVIATNRIAWVNGTPLHQLTPDVDPGRVPTPKQPLPPPCLTTHIYDIHPDYPTGIEIARRAYEEHLAHTGQPDRGTFDRWITSTSP